MSTRIRMPATRSQRDSVGGVEGFTVADGFGIHRITCPDTHQGMQSRTGRLFVAALGLRAISRRWSNVSPDARPHEGSRCECHNPRVWWVHDVRTDVRRGG
jgi:hypothetical protein